MNWDLLYEQTSKKEEIKKVVAIGMECDKSYLTIYTRMGKNENFGHIRRRSILSSVKRS